MHKTRFLSLGLLAATLITACQTPLPFQGNQFHRNRAIAFRAQNSGAQTINFKYKNKEQLQELAFAGMDIFGINRDKQTAQARVTPKDLNEFKKQKVQFSVRRDSQKLRGFPSGYMTYTTMRSKLQELAQKYPQLTTLADAGDSWEKTQGKSPSHDIYSLTITNKNSTKAKPGTLFMTGGVHARELAPVELVMKLAHYLLSEYGKNPTVTELLDTRKIILMPMVNVDGRHRVQAGSMWHRKNTHGPGVDLNRNYNNHWNYEGLNVPSSWKRGLTTPSSQIYSGTGPASEPETQAVQNIFKQNKVNVFMDVHAYGEMMIWPLGYSKKDIPEAPLYRKVWGDTFKPLGFRGGTSAQILYPTTATGRDYGYGKHGAFTMTLEVGHSFHPSYRKVEKMWEELRPNFLKMIKFSGEMK